MKFEEIANNKSLKAHIKGLMQRCKHRKTNTRERKLIYLK